MSYELFIGEYSYSSWSLRGWLLFRRYDLPVKIRMVPFHKRDVAEQLIEAGLSPARTVPTLRTDDGAIIWDSLAIAEELATRHPDIAYWPKDPATRAEARVYCAEMHSSYGSLRDECPMNLRAAYKDVSFSDGTLADIARIDTLWQAARQKHEANGPWLFGAYSIADAFFAPVAMRFAGYGAKLSDSSQSYVDTHLADPAFRRWRAMGLVSGETLEWYKKAHPTTEWPGPSPLEAKAVASGPSVNDRCPYSGDPVTHYLTFEDRIWGFCNAFCRDKTVADPEAWPAFMAMARAT